jgi:glutathione S-transferase
MILTLYGHAFSPLTQKVLIALVETKMPYAFVHVDLLAGENKAPEHLANNPFGTIPYIVSVLYAQLRRVVERA